MTVYIEGVGVENPTAVWTQLMNARHKVLDKSTRWNSKSWFEGDSASGYTMCLANAIRHVVRGKVEAPEVESSELQTTGHDRAVEALVLAAINKLVAQGTYRRDDLTYHEIPAYNDKTGRTFKAILKPLDLAIEWIKPHAQTYAIAYAPEVMTDDEQKEIREATRKVEAEMWAALVEAWGIHQDTTGNWRTRAGRFVKVPRWLQRETQPDSARVTVADVLGATAPERTRTQKEFRHWLDDHQERGWATFWDELRDCDGSKECEERLMESLH
jgi:hypothetical protein